MSDDDLNSGISAPTGAVAAGLAPLSPMEQEAWLAAKSCAPEDVTPAIAITRWRYLNDPVYHARVEMWEQEVWLAEKSHDHRD
jgi:hypothetical protein